MKSMKLNNLTIFIAVWFSVVLFINPTANRLIPTVLDGAVNYVENKSIEVNPHFSYDITVAKDDVTGKSKYYSGFPPGATFLAIPFYALLKPLIKALPEHKNISKKILYWDSYTIHDPQIKKEKEPHLKEVFYLNLFLVLLVMAPLAALFFVQFFVFIQRDCSPTYALFITASMFFGTMFFPYSCMYSRQALASFIVWNILLVFFIKKELSLNKTSVLTFILALAVTVDYSSVIMVFLSLILISISWPKKIRFYLQCYSVTVLLRSLFYC